MIKIRDKIIILEPGEAVTEEVPVKVIVKRGAFGSGEHETTRSCLELMCDIDFNDKLVLDIGSGTGILGITAILLGARKTIALDIDKDAVYTTYLNATLNGVSEKIEVYPYTIDYLRVEEPFDIILANIYGDVIKNMIPKIDAIAATNSKIILSGILPEDNFEIIWRFKNLGYKMIHNAYLSEYTTVLLEKRGPSVI